MSPSLALLVFLLASVAPFAAPSPALRSVAVAFADAADAEAAQVAENFVLSHFSDCGAHVCGRSGARYWQYKDFSWSLQRSPLTYKDVLFGVEWKGHLEIRVPKYRTYFRGSGSAKGRWSPWQTVGLIRIYMQKKTGVWNICSKLAHNDWPIVDTAPPCDELQNVPPGPIR
jgi:hypothetical protein